MAEHDAGERVVEHPTREELARFLPFGHPGRRLGRPAQNLLRLLTEEPGRTGQRFRWQKNDYESFIGAMRVEESGSLLSVAEEVPIEQHKAVAGRLLGSLATYREALPFDEAERRWIHDRYDELDRQPADAYRKYIPPLRTMDGEIMSAGRTQSVSGQELMQRWWLWRREMDEFDGQGSLERAQEGLRDISEMLVLTSEAYVARVF